MEGMKVLTEPQQTAGGEKRNQTGGGETRLENLRIDRNLQRLTQWNDLWRRLGEAFV